MKLSKSAVANKIEIWQPRWHDRVVLIAKFKVGRHNIITFSKAPTLKGEWYMSGETITKYPIETIKSKSGTTVPMYAVPLDELIFFEGRE